MTRILTLILLLLTAAAPAVHATDAEQVARHQHSKAIEALGQTSSDADLQKFALEHLEARYRSSFTHDALMKLLRSIRDVAAVTGDVLFTRDATMSQVRFLNPNGGTVVSFQIEPGVPYRIVKLGIEPLAAGDGAAPGQGASVKVAPISWQNLDARMTEEAKAGFSGTVLLVRGGKVVLHRGYGFADRDTKTPNDEHTIFAIGSTPIDFTHAAILKLEDMGKLKTSDPIAKYIDGVPADKQAMTLDHLMSGRSGLRDFHHIPGQDEDPDLTWIDRATAVERIMKSELLSPPGGDRKHSHSAWVLLAAIVEIASGETYGDFVRTNLFAPAGMMHTGLHEALHGVNDRGIAIGYDAGRAGDINSPKYWGRTSWLVMGSGGMESTPEDLYKFFTAVRGAKILSPASAKKFGPGGGVMVGGDDRGFLCMHAEQGNDMMFLCSNAHSGPGDHASSVGRRLAELVVSK